ncbi:predicted protein [Uncinocarpus reesii 1704]|uniref:Aminoglycoside phosphotransferase domain-containing protein n=1 Tax=Uncinocarpus reesii (strain UAMH 1704) TaxID=336963 RepID=C4JKQ2_UNCRE|nr:uncharacterized protein UREG_00650 [Uncinocarpus reesii 1704]EEP75803.1 predicted protein [Uncinocarpus reesii 1704]
MESVVRLVVRVLIRLVPQPWVMNICRFLKKKQKAGNNKGCAIIRLPGGIVAKIGAGVTPSEVATQSYAYHHLDRRIVCVPRIYHYFQDFSDRVLPTGYLFMEYIPGPTLEEFDEPTSTHLTQRLAKVVQLLQQFQANIPGPVGGGIPLGNMWGYHDAGMAFNSAEDLTAWVNRRIELLKKTVDFSPCPLVLCHLDLCRRNVIVSKDGSLYLLDWAFAGFYPRFYETAGINFYKDDFWKSFLDAVNKTIALTDDEKRSMDLILRARAASLRWIFYTGKLHTL